MGTPQYHPHRHQWGWSRMFAWLLIFPLTFPLHSIATATEVEVPFSDKDHNHHRIWDDGDEVDIGWKSAGPVGAAYQAEFVGVDRSIIGRADEVVTSLVNNVPLVGTLSSGQTTNFAFVIPNTQGNVGSNLPSSPPGSGLTKRSVQVLDISGESEDGDVIHTSLKKRQDSTQTVFISVTSCTQGGEGMQLTLYISQTEEKPGPGQDSSATQTYELSEGYVGVPLNASGNMFMGVYAPPVTNTAVAWSFVIGASVDNFVQEAAMDSSFAFLVDTDSNSALVSTSNLTDSQTSSDVRQQWLDMSARPPFGIFIFDSTTNLDGVRGSYCALELLQRQGQAIDMDVSDRNVGQNPKQDFHVKGLDPGTTYQAVLAYNGTGQTTQGANTLGGGKVWQSFTFTTKSDGNCQIIYGLQFCSDVAYAVPSNASSNMSSLVQFYDGIAEQNWQNFSTSLQQVACNTTDSAKYSLVKTCTDCKTAFKTWMCSALIPRCQDLSSTPAPAVFTLPRDVSQTFLNGSQPDLTEYELSANATQVTWYNSSRNADIDSGITPGPYRELLPCQDLCFEIVRSCPAAIGFACPTLGQGPLFNRSYGVFDVNTYLHNKTWTCNYLGIDPPTANDARRLMEYSVFWLVALVALHFIAHGL